MLRLQAEMQRIGKLPHIETSTRGAEARGTGTTIRFRPDPEIFGPKARFDLEEVRSRLEAKTYLHRGLRVIFVDEATGERLDARVGVEGVAVLDGRARRETAVGPIELVGESERADRVDDGARGPARREQRGREVRDPWRHAGVAAGAHERMNGGNPTMKSAMAVAWKRKKGVIGWALLATTVGLVLQAIKDKVKGGGAIIAMLGDLAWAVASFFAIPIIAANDVGPIEALKLSTSTMKKRWSSAARVQLRLGLYGLGLAVAMMVGLFLVALVAQSSTALAALLGVVLALVLLAAMLVLNAVTSYARVALYRYAAGMTTPGFADGMLQAAVVQK